jgi:hypothetical protein
MDRVLTSNWTLAFLLGLGSILAFLAHEPVIGVVAGGLAAMALVGAMRDE